LYRFLAGYDKKITTIDAKETEEVNDDVSLLLSPFRVPTMRFVVAKQLLIRCVAPNIGLSREARVIVTTIIVYTSGDPAVGYQKATSRIGDSLAPRRKRSIAQSTATFVPGRPNTEPHQYW